MHAFGNKIQERESAQLIRTFPNEIITAGQKKKERKTFMLGTLKEEIEWHIQIVMNAEKIIAKQKITTKLFNMTFSILDELQKNINC